VIPLAGEAYLGWEDDYKAIKGLGISQLYACSLLIHCLPSGFDVQRAWSYKGDDHEVLVWQNKVRALRSEK